MKKLLKYLFYLILFPLLIVGLYYFIAYIFTFFPKSITAEIKEENTIHILYSSIHTDIVFNIKDINTSRFSKFKNKKSGYLAFGWGDKEVYLNTPEFSAIQLSTTLKALFINTPSLMHVSYIPNISRYQHKKSIKLSREQKEHLEMAVMRSFAKEKNVYKGYGREDFFYTAKANYNLVNTCNTWTGDRLRESNISMPYWTPFVWSVVNTLP